MRWEQLKFKEKSEEKLRKDLNRRLYNAAKHCIDARFQRDSEAVKAKRDYECARMYGRAYSDLDLGELQDVINELMIQSEALAPSCATVVASKNQIKLFRFYALACALEYADFRRLTYCDEDTGVVYEGNDLKKYLKERFETKSGFIPRGLFGRLFSDWINPVSHKFLIEGCYQNFIKNSEKLYYESLHPEHLNYLITRFKQMYTNISNNVKSQDFDTVSRNN
jgi:hypothetical protein